MAWHRGDVKYLAHSVHKELNGEVVLTYPDLPLRLCSWSMGARITYLD